MTRRRRTPSIRPDLQIDRGILAERLTRAIEQENLTMRSISDITGIPMAQMHRAKRAQPLSDWAHHAISAWCDDVARRHFAVDQRQNMVARRHRVVGLARRIVAPKEYPEPEAKAGE